MSNMSDIQTLKLLNFIFLIVIVMFIIGIGCVIYLIKAAHKNKNKGVKRELAGDTDNDESIDSVKKGKIQSESLLNPNLFFGLFGLICITPFIIITISQINDVTNGITKVFALITIVFAIPLLFLTVIGISRTIKSVKTKKHGEECFGKIIEFIYTDSYIEQKDGYRKPEITAKIAVYISSQKITKIVTGNVGFNKEKLDLGMYVKTLYFDNYINVLETVDEETVPLNIKENIISAVEKYEVQQKLQYNKESEPTYVIINGVSYIKTVDNGVVQYIEKKK